jgi:AAA family ATP:ADP antiporter
VVVPLFFFVFASWYALRPLRDALGIAGSALPTLLLATLAVTLAVGPALSAMVSRLARRASIILAYRSIAATLVGFSLALRGSVPDSVAARAFFVWASVVNLVEITLAWALMADVFTREQGLRLFALVGGGGTLGAVVGSAVAALLARHGDPATTLIVAAVLLEAAVRCVDRVASSAPRRGALDTPYPAGGVLRWLGRPRSSTSSRVSS